MSHWYENREEDFQKYFHPFFKVEISFRLTNGTTACAHTAHTYIYSNQIRGLCVCVCVRIMCTVCRCAAGNVLPERPEEKRSRGEGVEICPCYARIIIIIRYMGRWFSSDAAEWDCTCIPGRRRPPRAGIPEKENTTFINIEPQHQTAFGAGWHCWKILAWQSPTSLTLLAERSFSLLRHNRRFFFFFFIFSYRRRRRITKSTFEVACIYNIAPFALVRVLLFALRSAVSLLAADRQMNSISFLLLRLRLVASCGGFSVGWDVFLLADTVNRWWWCLMMMMNIPIRRSIGRLYSAWILN